MTIREQALARRVSYQLETLWDFDYEPTLPEIEALYETAQKSQWNALTAIDWSRPIGQQGAIVNAEEMLRGTDFLRLLSDREKNDLEIKVSAWRLSQFLHGEQGALLVCGQLVNVIPDLDAKLYASTQVMDEGRHVEVYERYLKKLHPIYPVDPLLKSLVDEILSSEYWELKLVGMQMLIEGLAIASINHLRRQTRDATLADILDYVVRDEARHVNFGYLALKRSIASMEDAKRELLEDFALKACDALYGRDDRTGFLSLAMVFDEMGWPGARIMRSVINTPTVKAFNRILFTEVLIPRLQRLTLISPRVESQYRTIGLID